MCVSHAGSRVEISCLLNGFHVVVSDIEKTGAHRKGEACNA